jgi:hypothetical protein
MTISPEELRVHALELEYIASSLTNERIVNRLSNAAFALRVTADELANSKNAPVWLTYVSDLVYALCVSIIYNGWIVRTAITPGAKTFNVQSYAIDSYEKLAAALRKGAFVPTRASKQYPHTTRRKDIRKELAKHDRERLDS